MLLSELRSIDTSRRALRSFGVLVGGVLLALAAYVAWRRGWALDGVPAVLIGVGSGLMALGVLIPAILRPIYIPWMAVALVLGAVMTRVLLTLVFFLVVTPVGLVRRLVAKAPVRRPPDPQATTYWIAKTYPDASDGRLERYY